MPELSERDMRILAFDPVLVKRLRAQRARRQRMRSPRPKGTKESPA